MVHLPTWEIEMACTESTLSYGPIPAWSAKSTKGDTACAACYEKNQKCPC